MYNVPKLQNYFSGFLASCLKVWVLLYLSIFKILMCNNATLAVYNHQPIKWDDGKNESLENLIYNQTKQNLSTTIFHYSYGHLKQFTCATSQHLSVL